MPLTFGKEILDEGQFGQVICIVASGDEPLTISWALHGAIVSSDPGLTTTSLGTRSSMLTIQSVGYRHSGTYTCTATNAAGSSAESVELRVNGETNTSERERMRSQGHWSLIFTFACLFSDPPSIVPFSFGREVVNEGDYAQVTCSVSSGDEPLKITWSLKGDVISSEPTLTTTMIGTRTSILIINAVGYRHSGIYTCHASNMAGRASHSTELKVNGTLEGNGGTGKRTPRGTQKSRNLKRAWII